MKDDGQGGLDLIGMMPAGELAQMRRRVVFLEAALAQLLREQGQLREWFSAADLAAMMLPGMPRTRSGVAQLARAQRWEAKIATGRGGERYLYHFASLPRRAFEGLIDLVLRSVAPELGGAELLPAIEAPEVALAPVRNMAPPWVLPLLRILRVSKLPLDAALDRLPRRVHAGVSCPTPDEARAVLRSLGLLAEVG